nr:unnamed protein product [Callosobruchus analis]
MKIVGFPMLCEWVPICFWSLLWLSPCPMLLNRQGNIIELDQIPYFLAKDCVFSMLHLLVECEAYHSSLIAFNSRTSKGSDLGPLQVALFKITVSDCNI